MAAVSLFRGSNMAAVTSCENREFANTLDNSIGFANVYPLDSLIALT